MGSGILNHRSLRFVFYFIFQLYQNPWNRRLQQTSAVAARAGLHGNRGPCSHPTTTKKVQPTSKVCGEGGQKPQVSSGQHQRAQRQCLDASQDGYETTNRYPLEARNQGAETLNQACCLTTSTTTYLSTDWLLVMLVSSDALPNKSHQLRGHLCQPPYHPLYQFLPQTQYYQIVMVPCQS